MTARKKIWCVVKWIIGIAILAFLGFLAMILFALGPGNFGRLVLGIGVSFDKTPPKLPAKLPGNAILIFSKTNGFRDSPQIAAANRALEEIARQRGWSSYTTENAAIFNPAQLARFKVVVWSSVSGDVLTPDQRAAFRTWLEKGGGFVGLHGAGGDPQYAWRWYVDDLIGTQFVGHIMDPQFQTATLVVEDRTHPATRHLAPTWRRSDEWYSFVSSPRNKGYRILVTIDEKSYRPEQRLLPFTRPRDIRMGSDHPMVWTHCVGDGRAFYSALGHQVAAYGEPLHRQMIAGAIAWAAGLEGPGCAGGRQVNP
ncbi:ThuA domain-containing protein [Sphingobium sp. CAP-1]|uniref:ThuA domain-containing protein n=1 Tax=Sphingobium sp. CAP-1 TaxID=2676077 RepID=UPI0018AD2AA0|nr:ThuA domain-containing protein [Sphingobium sp. CAP-1]